MDHALPIPHAPGEVRPSRWKLLWNGALLLSAPLGLLYWDLGAALFAAGFAAFTLCLGHSVGLHRGVIHGAFRMHPHLERFTVYLSALTGIGGPISLMKMHDLRDLHQNLGAVPAYYSYAHSTLRDAWWYLCCVHIDDPKTPILPTRPESARLWFRWLEATWPLQQLPLAAALYAWGGLPWVVWGVGVRCMACVYGHWYVNYAAHTSGYRLVRMPGSGEEGRNHPIWGTLAMGEGWHNNHHAWPSSARFGVTSWELDPGWWAVQALAALGWVKEVRTWAGGAPMRPGAQVERIDSYGDALRRWWADT